MNTFSVDMGTHKIACHTTEHHADVWARHDFNRVEVANYRHLAREFKRGRRFVRWENGYAEIVRAKK